jgi:hypothetical protein
MSYIRGDDGERTRTLSFVRRLSPPGRTFFKFNKLSRDLVGQPVVFRARLHNMRPQGEWAS